MSKTMQELKQAIEDRDEVIEKLMADIAERDKVIQELRNVPYPQDFHKALKLDQALKDNGVDWSFLEKK